MSAKPTPSLDLASAQDRLAVELLRRWTDGNVRLLEAVAMVLANRAWKSAPAGRRGEIEPELTGCGGRLPALPIQDERVDICRRIAKRALASRSDPRNPGATSFHHELTPAPWAVPLPTLFTLSEYVFYGDAASDGALQKIS
ncbi:MAG: hypothetical protein ACFB6S_06590 [Geminicoccaceae bacterium]